jgi:hypothetical protein
VQFTVAPAPAQKMEEKFRLQANFFKKLISSLLMPKLVKQLVYLSIQRLQVVLTLQVMVNVHQPIQPV